MRYVFYSLLVLNIAYFAWAQTQAGATPATAKSPVRYPPKTETLYLLSENGVPGSRNAQMNTTINSPVRRGAAGAATCIALGPFADLFAGQDVVSKLQALDISGELRAIDQATGEKDYRVLIPPASSLQDAFRKLRELKSRNIDSYVITEGMGALGISLGVFSSEAGAKKAQAMRAREGYATDVIEIPRLSREFWIFGAGGAPLDLSADLMRSLVGNGGELEQKSLSCPSEVANLAK